VKTQARIAAPHMAENHQRRCNPAIGFAAEAFSFNILGVAKNMHIFMPHGTRH
jgi:hypothetical protein